jgi:hypothetical protein
LRLEIAANLRSQQTTFLSEFALTRLRFGDLDFDLLLLVLNNARALDALGGGGEGAAAIEKTTDTGRGQVDERRRKGGRIGGCKGRGMGKGDVKEGSLPAVPGQWWAG